MLTGATGGTGLAIARELSGQGLPLVLSGRNEDRLQTFRKELSNRGGEVETVACDLFEPSAPEKLVESALAWRGRLDALILCAGGSRFTFFERMSKSDFDHSLRLNLSANVDLVRQALPHLKSRPRGWIIMVNTIASREPAPPRGSAYLAAKAGLRYFADGLFSEVRDSGISVTSILPDLTDTPLVPASLGYDRRTLIRPRSVAQAVLFAMSNDADCCVTEIHLRPQPSLRFEDGS